MIAVVIVRMSVAMPVIVIVIAAISVRTRRIECMVGGIRCRMTVRYIMIMVMVMITVGGLHRAGRLYGRYNAMIDCAAVRGRTRDARAFVILMVMWHIRRSREVLGLTLTH